MISKVKIEGFKSIRSASIELNPINILIGGNGAGKSNFATFFEFVKVLFDQNLGYYSLKKGVDNLLHFGRKYTNEIHGRIEFINNHIKEKNAYEVKLETSQDGKLFITEETFCYDRPHNERALVSGTGWYNQLIGRNLQESLLRNRPTKISRYVKKLTHGLKVFHFHDTSENSTIRSPCDIHDNIELREDGGNLAAFLYYLQEQEHEKFKAIQYTINSVAPYFGGFELRPNRLNDQSINLEWRDINRPSIPLRAHQFSDGMLRFIAMTTLLLQPNLPPVIILDEPELGLHPVAVSKLAGLVRKASVYSQIIIATQSVALLNYFNPEDILTVDLVNSESSFERLKSDKLEDWLSTFSLGQLWQMSEIKGQPF